MRIAILGPLEARADDDRPVEIAGLRLRALLARLAIDAGHPVSVGALVAAVWADRPPADENNALQTLVSRLRRAFGTTAAIAQSPAGYRLDVEPDDVDATRFEALATAGAAALRAGRPVDALEALDAALALWRGNALADLRDSVDALRDHATRLEDLRLAGQLDRAEARAAAGVAADVPELERIVADRPLHERATAQLIRALAATGRQADALLAYESVRTHLADELGADPSGELQQLHLELLRAADVGTRAPRRTNLKAALTSFVGRDDEVARIGKSLEQNRLVTLVGPGGAGKTRLAVEAAAGIVDTAPDGIWMAELAAVTDGSDVPQAVLGSVGLREVHALDRHAPLTPRDALSRLKDGLVDRRAVLILDNCEHVIDASAQLAEALLSECPDLRVLTTSREPLGILGEALLAVPPLGQPAPAATAADAVDYPAVRLFVDRAAAARPDFVLDDATVGSVVEIVRRLDGLPLAIELAAARLRSMPVDDIAGRLSDRFRLLTGGSRTALPRHRTLRAVVEWSWDLLRPVERRLVEQLAVFPSGVTVAGATAVRPDDVAADDVEDLLASLIDKSLLQPVDGGRRLRMLETIREYGIDRLAERGELGAARARHADHFAAVLTQAEPHLTTSGQLPWFDLLTAERENILAAMRFRADTGDGDAALRIGVSLAGFAMMLGDHDDISDWMRYGLAVPGGLDDDLRTVARALQTMNFLGGGATAATQAELHELAVQMDDVRLPTPSMLALLRPAVAFFTGDMALTRRYAQEAIDGDDQWASAAVRMFLAGIEENVGDVDAMRHHTAVALEQFRALGERWGLASTLRNAAQLCVLDGDLTGAEDAYVESLQLMGAMKSSDDEVFIRGRLADLALRRGDVDGARAQLDHMPGGPERSVLVMESIYATTMLADVEMRAGNDARAQVLVDDAMSRLVSVPQEHPALGHIRAVVLATAARLLYSRGEVGLADEHARGAFRSAVGTNDLPILALVGVTLAGLAAAAGRPVDAAQMLGAATRLRGADDATNIDVLALTARLQGELGADAFDAEYGRGRALAHDEAVARLDPAR